MSTAIHLVFLRTSLHVAQLVPLSVFVTLDSARLLTHSPFATLKTFAHPTNQQIHISMKNFTGGVAAVVFIILCHNRAIVLHCTEGGVLPEDVAHTARQLRLDTGGVAATFCITRVTTQPSC